MMGITKKDLFTKHQNEFAQIAKVFGHPARLAIIEYLLETKTCICGDLVEELGLAQATISQHLRELKKLALYKAQLKAHRFAIASNQKNGKKPRIYLSPYLINILQLQRKIAVKNKNIER